MSEAETPQVQPAVDQPGTPAEETPVVFEKAAPIESRFLYVDVAALRAKQLRRGARQRLGDDAVLPHKAERVAMEEVKRGLVQYDAPPAKPPQADEADA